MAKQNFAKQGMACLFVALLLLGSACTTYDYQQPEVTGDRRATGKLEEADLDPEPLVITHHILPAVHEPQLP